METGSLAHPAQRGLQDGPGFVAEGRLFAEGSDAGISFKRIPLAPAFS